MKSFKLGLLAAVLVSCTSCANDMGSDEELRKQTEATMKEANAQIGMPAIKNFQERKLAKMIFELRDKEDLICYAYIVNQMKGELVFIGKCIGFGLPHSVQYTNPEKVIKHGSSTYYSGGSPSTIPQPDPNGLFMPSGLSATWLMMIDPQTREARPVYIEPEIVASPLKMH